MAPKTLHFDQWLAKQPRGTATRIFRECGLSLGIIGRARRREPIKRYLTAQRLSEATGGKVTIKTLCEPGAK